MAENTQQQLQLARQYQQQGLMEQAEQLYRRILSATPTEAEALYGLGIIASQYDYLDAAEKLLTKAIQAKPRRARYYLALGNVFFNQKRLLSAIVTYEHALQLEPAHPEVLHNMAVAYEQKNEQELAIERYFQALSTNPEQAISHFGVAQLYYERDEPHRAAHHYLEAVRIQPNMTVAWCHLASLYIAQGYIQMGMYYLQQAIMQPDCDPQAQALYLYYQQFDVTVQPTELLKQAQQWYKGFAAPLSRQPFTQQPIPNRRLKLAYLLPDLTANGPVCLLSTLFQAVNQEQFEVIILYEGRRFDDVSHWFQTMADQWEVTFNLTDEQLTDLIRRHGIDILVYLGPYRPHQRGSVFTTKPAPVQIVGCLMDYSSGLPGMDGYLTWPRSEPLPSIEPLTILKQPWCWQPSKSVAELPLTQPPVLRRGAIVLGYCGEHLRINPTVLRLWADILHQLPQAYLHICLTEDDHPAFAQVYRHYLSQYGIAEERLAFSVRLAPLAGFEFYRTIDISLAPFPASNVAVACESLWMGTPIVAMANGNGAVAHLLHQVGLPEWVMTSPDGYLQTIVQLAKNPQLLSDLRPKIRQKMKDSPLMDATTYILQLELKYRELWQTWCQKRTVKQKMKQR